MAIFRSADLTRAAQDALVAELERRGYTVLSAEIAKTALGHGPQLAELEQKYLGLFKLAEELGELAGKALPKAVAEATAAWATIGEQRDVIAELTQRLVVSDGAVRVLMEGGFEPPEGWME